MVSRKFVSKGQKKKQEEKTTNNSRDDRFFYEGGDKDNFAIFRYFNAKATLRSLYLEYCTVISTDLLDTLEGCQHLKIIKLVQVHVEHEVGDFKVKNFRGIYLPNLTSLYVSDNSSTVSEILHDKPFRIDRGLDDGPVSPAEELVNFHIDFYSQLLCHQLRGEKSLRLCTQLSSLKVDISINLADTKIFLWFQSIENCEKLVISPLICSWNDNFLKNFVDAATVKYLACSDRIFSLEKTPYKLEELNLYISNKKSSLVTDLTLSKKLSTLSTLILYFENKFMIDLKILALNLHKLNDLVITNSVIHSTASEPLKVSDCCFEQCSFSESFMSNVSKFLQCNNLALDINQIRNWDGVFKINLMKMSRIKRILTWSVNSNTNDKEEKEEEIVFLEEYVMDILSGHWKNAPFDNDPKFRRSVLLHHHDFFPDPHDWDKKNLELFNKPSVPRRDVDGSGFERKTLFMGKILGFVVCGLCILVYYLLTKK